MRKSKKMIVKCSWCGRDIYAYPSRVKRSKNLFCNVGCRARFQKGKQTTARKRVIWECNYCGNEFEMIKCYAEGSKRHFCSKDCRAKYFSDALKGDKHWNWNPNRIKLICKECGSEFERLPSQIKREGRGKFCSGKCRLNNLAKRNSVNRVGAGNPNWKNGASFEVYPSEFNDELKNIIRKRDNFTCQLCKNKQNDLLPALSIHHIDEDKHNNSHDNLISLCRSCHMKTHKNSKAEIRVGQV